jgi:hypothetical protein
LKDCNGKKAQWATYDDKQSCTRLAGPINTGNSFKVLNKTNPDAGIEMDLNPGDSCTVGNYTVDLTIICNDTMPFGAATITNPQDFSVNKCSNKLTIQTREACSDRDLFNIWGFIKAHPEIFGGVLIAIGLFAVFLGYYMIVVTVFIVSAILVVAFVFIILFQFIIPNGVSHTVVWVVLGISIVVGLILAFIIARYNKTLIGLPLGGYLGYLGGSVLYNLLLVRIAWNHTVSFYD